MYSFSEHYLQPLAEPVKPYVTDTDIFLKNEAMDTVYGYYVICRFMSKKLNIQ